MSKEKCDICGTQKSKSWMMQGKYMYCDKCSEVIAYFNLQPMQRINETVRVLMETMFRRGKGEDVSFKEVYKERHDFDKLIDFDDMVKKEVK